MGGGVGGGGGGRQKCAETFGGSAGPLGKAA